MMSAAPAFSMSAKWQNRSLHLTKTPLLSRFGVSAPCRASFGLYNTREELDGLAQALIKAQGFFA
jgi:selenocysteine lyase/cysteine desulfurase